MNVIRMDCSKMRTWDELHSEFQRVFGFPDFYGRNLNAWIDCMTDLDEPGHGMTKVHVGGGEVLTIALDNVDALPDEIHGALVDCAAFVNYRRLDVGDPPVLALSYLRNR